MSRPNRFTGPPPLRAQPHGLENPVPGPLILDHRPSSRRPGAWFTSEIGTALEAGSPSATRATQLKACSIPEDVAGQVGQRDRRAMVPLMISHRRLISPPQARPPLDPLKERSSLHARLAHCWTYSHAPPGAHDALCFPISGRSPSPSSILHAAGAVRRR